MKTRMRRESTCEFMIPYGEWNYGFTVYDFERCRKAVHFEMLDAPDDWRAGQPDSTNKRFVS